MSCAKMDELIETQFVMLSQEGAGNIYHIGVYVPPRKGALLGVSEQLKSIEA